MENDSILNFKELFKPRRIEIREIENIRFEANYQEINRKLNKAKQDLFNELRKQGLNTIIGNGIHGENILLIVIENNKEVLDKIPNSFEGFTVEVNIIKPTDKIL